MKRVAKATRRSFLLFVCSGVKALLQFNNQSYLVFVLYKVLSMFAQLEREWKDLSRINQQYSKGFLY